MARNSASSSRLAAAAFAAAVTMSGCTPDELVKLYNDNVGSRIGLPMAPLTKVAPTPTPTPSAETPNSEHRRVNGEFIKELFKSVLRREVRSEEEFSRYMNVLDQGGHYEGIYNGIVYSSEYKDLEKAVAPTAALKMYAQLMTQILLDQRYDTLKIAKPEAPDVPAPESKSSVAPPQPTDAERAQLISEQEQEAITKSFFTLKRRLGEEVLKTIDLKKEYKEKFATWYGRYTVFLNKLRVNFGIPQRNRTDELYHYKWALDAEEDRLKWECLNRLHMLMNSTMK